ncbi:helix-turn-helix domain-containing protein [Bradyrhizobium sp.]|uniref:helix-turn-helix domain-containing protein n=1 Tax=Bradyrhizobium sp. TaxID=376 RepID=UPI004037EDAA
MNTPSHRTVYRLSKQQLERIDEFVESRIARNIRIAELSSAIKMSPSHFSHRFKRTTGISPHAFVTKRKILKAEQLLRQTSCTLEEIAGKVGYSNLGHFRRQFRKSLGYAPGNLREVGAGNVLRGSAPKAVVKVNTYRPAVKD